MTGGRHKHSPITRRKNNHQVHCRCCNQFTQVSGFLMFPLTWRTEKGYTILVSGNGIKIRTLVNGDAQISVAVFRPLQTSRISEYPSWTQLQGGASVRNREVGANVCPISFWFLSVIYRTSYPLVN